jgi:hypothetical protein
MTDLVPLALCAPPVTDEQLAASRPSPRRDPALVARRAELLNLQPHRRTANFSLIWPFLTIGAVVALYLLAAVALEVA